MLDLVGNPEDRFSHKEAQLIHDAVEGVTMAIIYRYRRTLAKLILKVPRKQMTKLSRQNFKYSFSSHRIIMFCFSRLFESVLFFQVV